MIDKVSYEALSRRAGQGFVDQDNLADPLIKQNSIETREASPELMAILKQRVSFYKDNWAADAKSRGIDAEAAYDFFVETAQESTGLTK